MRWLRIIFLTFFLSLVIIAVVKLREFKKPLNSPVFDTLTASLPNENSGTENPKPIDQLPIEFSPPLDSTENRITKKPFGIFISSATSPVQPEKFSGYHTGTDFEIFPEEINTDVAVKAICNGKLLLKKYASGYGGVAVESCFFNQQPITVVYGHLKLGSIEIPPGQNMEAGSFLGILGKNHSTETDGERKHLHLGVHKGSEINIRGYVNSKSELSSWIDPIFLIFKN